MPIISFTESDKLAAIPCEPGWYKAVVKTCDMKASGSEKSINFWTEFEITTDGKFKGKEIKCSFNTKTTASSILGGTQFRPHSDLLQLYAAINNITLAEVPLNFDTDTLLLKEFDLQVLIDAEGGIMTNHTGSFMPAGKVSGVNGQIAF